MWLFCYGSNNPEQLADRLGHAVKVFPAYVEHKARVFRGYSERWRGATASLLTADGRTTYGYCAKVSAADMTMLDRFEGVAQGIYRRQAVLAVDRENATWDAIAYVSCSVEKGQPSRAYLEAVAKTVGSFWSGSHGKVTWRDFPIR